DYDRFASLFTQDAVWRIPVVNVEFVGREEIRAGIERLGEGLWDYLVQTTHPGTIQLEGDTASGRAYVLGFGHMRAGSSHLTYSVYHDRYRRTPEGWKFTERADEIMYLDTTPLAGSPPQKTTTTRGPPGSVGWHRSTTSGLNARPQHECHQRCVALLRGRPSAVKGGRRSSPKRPKALDCGASAACGAGHAVLPGPLLVLHFVATTPARSIAWSPPASASGMPSTMTCHPGAEKLPLYYV